jgi:hypothetical protein
MSRDDRLYNADGSPAEEPIDFAAERARRNTKNDEPPPVNGPDDYTDRASAEPKATPRLKLISAKDWEGQQAPERKWLVPGRLLRGKAAILSGEGAVGKTLVALQLGIGVVLGRDWLGAIVNEAVPVLFYSAEEDIDEMHLRTATIAGKLKILLPDLADLHFHCRPGEDAVLGHYDRNSRIVKATPLFHQLETEVRDLRVGLVIVEAAADVFAVANISFIRASLGWAIVEFMKSGSIASVPRIPRIWTGRCSTTSRRGSVLACCATSRRSTSN